MDGGDGGGGGLECKYVEEAEGEDLLPRPCMTCRKRRTLCDRRKPCSRCMRLGVECTLPPTVKRGRPSAWRWTRETDQHPPTASTCSAFGREATAMNSQAICEEILGSVFAGPLERLPLVRGKLARNLRSEARLDIDR